MSKKAGLLAPDPVPAGNNAYGDYAAPQKLATRRLILAAKLVVAVGLFVWLFLNVGVKELAVSLGSAKLAPLALAAVLCFSSVVLSAYKWQLLLEIHGLKYTSGQIQRWFFIASFLNMCLPSTIGGDVYRIYKTLGNSAHRACSVLAVFVHRLTGMGAWLLLGFASLVAIGFREPDNQVRAVAYAAAVIGVLAVLALILMKKLSLAERIMRHRRCPRALAALIRFSGDYRDAPGRMTVVVAASLLYHILRVAFVWLIIYALGESFDPLQLTASMVVADSAGLLPISLGGLGVMDGSLVYLLGYFGLPHAVGLSTVLLNRAMSVPPLVLGGIFYLTERQGGGSAKPR